MFNSEVVDASLQNSFLSGVQHAEDVFYFQIVRHADRSEEVLASRHVFLIDSVTFDCDVGELVLSRARRALEAGCDGVISSGLEVPRLRELVDSKLLVVTPGIRPVDNKPEGDQKRVVTVETAFASGVDYIVVGRPIRDAQSPRAAAESIQASIASVVES